MTQQTPQTKLIQAYSIFEYTQKIQQNISEGYYFKLETNEGTPQQFGFHYEVTMYKNPTIKLKVPESTYVIDNEDVPTIKIVTVQPQKQRGRPITK